jgi:hypothetical protein
VNLIRPDDALCSAQIIYQGVFTFKRRKGNHLENSKPHWPSMHQEGEHQLHQKEEANLLPFTI